MLDASRPFRPATAPSASLRRSPRGGGFRRFSLAIWGGLLAGWLTACGGPQAPPPKNLILITLDTVRADALGFTGSTLVKTPTLDRLAQGGRVFTDAHAHNVVTLPSHTNILTGLYPYQHGVRDNGGFILRGEVPTLASVLAREGFETAAFVGAYPLASRFGLSRGFGVYDEVKVADTRDLVGGLPDPRKPFGERPGDQVLAQAKAWWQANPGKNRFLWVHLFDAHGPYLPPEPFASRYAESRYHGEIAAIDSYLEPWLEPFLAGREEPTLVVLTADHGESLGEHGERAHGLFAYEATLKVPLVLWGPGVEVGRDDWPARHIDLMPTVLKALGKNVPQGLPGRDLLGPRDQDPRQVDAYFESLSTHLNNGWAPLRGMLRDRWKLIELPIPELYHLETDPHEAKNLFTEERRQARSLLDALPALSKWPPERGQLSSEEIAELRSLGYLVGEAKRSESYGPEDDPKNLATLQVEMQDAVRVFHEGQLEEAMTRCRKIIAQRRDTGLAWTYLAFGLIRTGRQAEAISLMQEAVRDKVAPTDLRRQLGLSLLWNGRPHEAIEVLAQLAKDSPDLTTLNNLALAYVAIERAELAVPVLETALAGEGGKDAGTYENFAYVLLQLSDAPRAEAQARIAIDLEPKRVGAWNNLALALYHQQRAPEAVETWRKATDLDPKNLDTLFNLGSVAAEIGAIDLARPALRRFLALAPPDPTAQRQAAQKLLRQLGG